MAKGVKADRGQPPPGEQRSLGRCECRWLPNRAIVGAANQVLLLIIFPKHLACFVLLCLEFPESAQHERGKGHHSPATLSFRHLEAHTGSLGFFQRAANLKAASVPVEGVPFGRQHLAAAQASAGCEHYWNIEPSSFCGLE